MDEKANLGQILQDSLEKLVDDGIVTAAWPGNVGHGGVWVPGIGNTAMDACLRQMAQAGFLSAEARQLLGV